MLIIYDDAGNITMATTDDSYVTRYQKKHNKFPFMEYGTKALWLPGKPFIETIFYKVNSNNELVKKDEIEIQKIENERKNNIKTKTIVIKGNFEIIEEEEKNAKTNK